MTFEQFCYWFQGFVEVRGAETDALPTRSEWEVIKDHLKTVFEKVTPERNAMKLLNELRKPQSDGRVC